MTRDLTQSEGDDIYAHLMLAHENLTKSESDALNARLILLLINEIADPDRVRAAIDAAR